MKIVAAALFAFIALTASAQSEFLKPEGISAPRGYTHVVVTHPGKLIYISGQVANDREGKIVGKSDLRAQAKQVFENLNLALAAAGATFNDVVKLNYYVKNLQPSSLPIVREVRDAYINTKQPPASTLVGVTALANEDYLLEVEAVAVIPEGNKRKK